MRRANPPGRRPGTSGPKRAAAPSPGRSTAKPSRAKSTQKPGKERSERLSGKSQSDRRAAGKPGERSSGPAEVYVPRAALPKRKNPQVQPGVQVATEARRPLSREEIEADFMAFRARLEAQGLRLSDKMLADLRQYGEFVLERSAALNLVSLHDRPRFFLRHMAECLSEPLVRFAESSGSLVDIGTGAGLPGIPLALVCPELKVLLVEPRLRKAQFLEAAISRAGISSRVEVYHGTAEKLIRASEGQLGSGLATARAVDRLEIVWGWAQGLLKPGGWLATFKGPQEAGAAVKLLPPPAPAEVRQEPIVGETRALLFLRRP